MTRRSCGLQIRPSRYVKTTYPKLPLGEGNGGPVSWISRMVDRTISTGFFSPNRVFVPGFSVSQAPSIPS